MPGRRAIERVALWVCLPALLAVSLATWRLWRHVTTLDDSLVQSKQVELELLADVRNAVGREQLAGRALDRALQDLESALSETRRVRAEADEAQQDSERNARIAERLRQQRMDELDRMSEALSRIAETDRTPMGMVVQLGEDSFLFDFDSVELMPRNREILSRIAGVLLASYGYKIYIYGHTDDQGNAAYNQALSERRADSVRAYLVEAGVPPEILASKGFGQASPRVPGTSRQARRKNRRVEIGIVDTVVEYTGAVPAGPDLGEVKD
ncbi:MAG: OmpA family protein [Bryobacterales bacterium]|nr:OmpA family protein [Bryobacterales bacterium]